MRVLEGHEAARGALRAPAVAIGQFDGVHAGHRAVVGAAVAAARARGAEAVVLTFEPHPAAVLAPGRAPARLSDREEKLDRLEALGVDTVVVQRFDHAFAGIEPDAFVRDVLGEALGACEVAVGWNFHFGHGARGSASTLEALGAAQEPPIRVTVVPALEVGGVVCSSTAIRERLEAGEVAVAARLLGRPYALTGRVVEGRRRGRLIGFPTANLEVSGRVVPRPGVYAVRVQTEAAGAWHDGVCNVGTAPTFGGEAAVRVEVHLLDFEGDLYGRAVRVEWIDRLRDERAFDGVDALKAQIARDVDAGRAVLRAARERQGRAA